MSETKQTAPSAQDQFDEATSRQLEAVYLTPDVIEQREKIMALFSVRPGEKALDIGCGPGLTTLALAEATGSTGQVTGVDIAEPMLAIARKRCAHFSHVSFTTADVTSLPYDDASFTIALATQVYEYVEQVDQALVELARVVQPGGRVLIVDTDWESAVWASNDDVRMRRVIDTWNTHIPHPQLPRDLKLRMERAGFKHVRVEVVPLVNTVYDAQTFSVGMMTLLGAFAEGRNGLTQKDIQDWKHDARVMGEQQRYFFSLNRYVFIADR